MGWLDAKSWEWLRYFVFVLQVLWIDRISPATAREDCLSFRHTNMESHGPSFKFTTLPSGMSAQWSTWTVRFSWGLVFVGAFS